MEQFLMLFVFLSINFYAHFLKAVVFFSWN